jgi:nicotinate-nucleotide adenylyltransferase
MLKKVTAEKKTYIVSDIEAKRSAPSYSIDTIKILRPLIGQKAELYFIIGADAFVEIDTWKCFKELPGLVSFVIISRPGFRPEKIKEVVRNAFAGYKYDPVQGMWNSQHSKGSFILLHMEPVPISSTEIRKRVKRGEEIAGLVPPAVEKYIKKQKLYI